MIAVLLLNNYMGIHNYLSKSRIKISQPGHWPTPARSTARLQRREARTTRRSGVGERIPPGKALSLPWQRRTGDGGQKPKLTHALASHSFGVHLLFTCCSPGPYDNNTQERNIMSKSQVGPNPICRAEPNGP